MALETKAKRMSGLTSREQRWINRLLTTNRLDITKPFSAAQALEAIYSDLEECKETHKTLRYFPNHVRMNYVLRKSKLFDCSRKNEKSTNYWTLRDNKNARTLS